MKFSIFLFPLLLAFFAALAPAAHGEELWFSTQDGVGSDQETINAFYDGPSFDIGMSCQLKPHIAGLLIRVGTFTAATGQIKLILHFFDRPPLFVTWPAVPGQPGTFDLSGQPAQEAIIAMDGATVMGIALATDPGRQVINTMGKSEPTITSIRRGCGF